MDTNAQALAAHLLRLSRALFFSLPPFFAMVFAMPLAFLPFTYDERPLELTHYLLAAPVYVGLLCAPGYLYTAAALPCGKNLSRRRRWWVRISLLVSILCGLEGIVGGYMLFFFIPPSLISVGLSAYLLWRTERCPAQP